MIAMTDAECAEILAEFRKLTLGPELSAAMDHAIGVLVPTIRVPVEDVDLAEVAKLAA